MAFTDRTNVTRRGFLSAAGLAACTGFGRAGDPPPAYPRATSGDREEPVWSERLTVSVSPKTGDIVGADQRALQAAVDYVARLGGGTVKILPGTYRLRNAVYLQSNVRIVGSGEDSILIKEPSTTVKLVADSDWYDQEVTLADGRGFALGDGVCLRARNPHNGGSTVIKRTLVARSGNRFKLDRALRENIWLGGESTASTLFPILSGENVADVVIENLTLDGNRENNANLDGNYAGCIFLQDCKRFRIRGVTARNYNGDGLSWQVCHDVHVSDCVSEGHAGLGLHPGSGSQRAQMTGNRIRQNDIGIFFCWGVKRGLAVGNVIEDCRSYGVSIGHCDVQNVVRDNDIRRSGKAGLYFRAEANPAFSPHDNEVTGNRIVDSGGEDGVGIDIQGVVEKLKITTNRLHETRGPGRRIGIRIGAKASGNNRVDGNSFDGFARDVFDQRKA